jgi:hypothetical protein
LIILSGGQAGVRGVGVDHGLGLPVALHHDPLLVLVPDGAERGRPTAAQMETFELVFRDPDAAERPDRDRHEILVGERAPDLGTVVVGVRDVERVVPLDPGAVLVRGISDEEVEPNLDRVDAADRAPGQGPSCSLLAAVNLGLPCDRENAARDLLHQVRGGPDDVVEAQGRDRHRECGADDELLDPGVVLAP